ncbi:MAG: hypothetical protein H7123_06745 [Thermoleophilia bacterium]|nr:hypothetical protein [Thermoleophilia bacterium]
MAPLTSLNYKKVFPVHAILALAFVAAFAIGSVNPAKADAASGLSCKVQKATLKLCSARTDNYKDCFNEADGQRELRTWLSMSAVRARRAEWKITAGQSEFADTLTVRRTTTSTSLPRRAVLTVTPSHPDQVTVSGFRIGNPSTFWGPLVTLTSSVKVDAPVKLIVRLKKSNGTELGHTSIYYRYDAAIANAPEGSIEYNGPGGRWFVGSRRTKTAWELGSGAQC